MTNPDIARTRMVLERQQRWWEVVDRAAKAHRFESFHDAWLWLQSVPKLPPSRAVQREWLEAERIKAGCYRGGPIIPEDRQLAIAIAAAELIEARLPDTAEHVRILNGTGFTDPEISERIGVSVRQVLRWRTQLGLPPRSHGGAVMAEQHIRLGRTA